MTLIYRTIKPSEKVKDFVRFYWFLESDEPYTYLSVADVSPQLIFHYNGQFDEILEGGKRELSFISGVSAASSYTRKFQIDHSFGVFGVYFYPHTISLLFDIPADEFTNQLVDLHTLSQKHASSLEDKIMDCNSDEKRIGFIESFILERLRCIKQQQLPVFKALHYIMNSELTPKVCELASDYSLSERQLERQFYRYTGFAPKQFIRITRFQRALRLYGQKNMNLTDIAMDCGYYDQSHFINDFKQFSGINPKEYFNGKSLATNWRDSEKQSN